MFERRPPDKKDGQWKKVLDSWARDGVFDLMKDAADELEWRNASFDQPKIKVVNLKFYENSTW